MINICSLKLHRIAPFHILCSIWLTRKGESNNFLQPYVSNNNHYISMICMITASNEEILHDDQLIRYSPLTHASH